MNLIERVIRQKPNNLDLLIRNSPEGRIIIKRMQNQKYYKHENNKQQ